MKRTLKKLDYRKWKKWRLRMIHHISFYSTFFFASVFIIMMFSGAHLRSDWLVLSNSMILLIVLVMTPGALAEDRFVRKGSLIYNIVMEEIKKREQKTETQEKEEYSSEEEREMARKRKKVTERVLVKEKCIANFPIKCDWCNDKVCIASTLKI